MQVHIVWNAGKNEGVIFTDYHDAYMTAMGADHLEDEGRNGALISTLGMAFAEIYGTGDEAPNLLQSIEIETPHD